jgi:hypothetical protein
MLRSTFVKTVPMMFAENTADISTISARNERKNRTLKEVENRMIQSKGLSLQFWA